MNWIQKFLTSLSLISEKQCHTWENSFFNDPSKELNLIGVGGTKGKSTTAYYVKAIVDDYLAVSEKKKVPLSLPSMYMMA